MLTLRELELYQQLGGWTRGVLFVIVRESLGSSRSNTKLF